MLLFAGFVVALAFYVAQNPGTQQVSLFTWQFGGIPNWLPAVTAAATTFLLMLLYSSYAGVRSTMRQWGLRRRLGGHESAIGGLREENERLRADNARLRGRVEGAPATDPSAGPTPANRVRTFFRS